MNFFETSDKKVIFDIDKIKMIDNRNGNQLIVYLDGIKQYYVLSDDSNKILEKLKDKIVPIYSTEEPTETPSEKPTEAPTEEPSTDEPTTDESIDYCGATNFYLGTDDQSEFNWPNENTIIHPDSKWELEEEGGARQLLNPNGSLKKLRIKIFPGENRIIINPTYEGSELPELKMIGIQEGINYSVHCSEPSSSLQLIHIN